MVCALGKATRLPFPAAPLAHDVPPGNTWFVDLSGPLPVGAYGHGNAKYAMMFVDAFTRVKCLYLLKVKSDALIGFLKFFQWTFEQNITVRQLRSDRGGEFVGNGVLNFLATKNIVLHQSATGDSETQGSIERQFRTLWNSIRCMLLDQDLPSSYWGLAALYSVYLDNRSLANTDDVTRLELLTGRPPHVDRVHVFGGPVVWIPSVKINTEGKLAPRARDLRSRAREAAAPRTEISEAARRKLIMEQNIQDVPSSIVSSRVQHIRSRSYDCKIQPRS